MIPAVTLATRAIQRRPYSLMASLRAMGRSMEAHPFQRPAGTKGAPADWGKQARRTISQVVM